MFTPSLSWAGPELNRGQLLPLLGLWKETHVLTTGHGAREARGTQRDLHHLLACGRSSLLRCVGKNRRRRRRVSKSPSPTGNPGDERFREGKKIIKEISVGSSRSCKPLTRLHSDKQEKRRRARRQETAAFGGSPSFHGAAPCASRKQALVALQITAPPKLRLDQPEPLPQVSPEGTYLLLLLARKTPSQKEKTVKRRKNSLSSRLCHRLSPLHAFSHLFLIETVSGCGHVGSGCLACDREQPLWKRC